jgi:acetyltransferase-like isoleucine patch superfamily enzyme
MKKFIQKINQLFRPSTFPLQDGEIQPDFFMADNPKYRDYEIGKWTYGSPKVRQGDHKSVLKIGKYCSFASGVQILLGGEHRTDWISTYPFNILLPEALHIDGHPNSKGDIIIGNDVWIGLNAIILSGVTVGNGAVIGAGAIVVKDVPPYSIAAGNPAKIIRYRFTEEQINHLEQIAWWNWPDEKVREAIPIILNDNVDRFIRKYYVFCN